MRSILRSPHFAVVLVAVLYVALLSWASIDRHATFGSSGYDLGIFDQAAWLLGHGHAPFSTVRGRELMADHFQPAIFLLAIFGAVGASPVGLLILQSTVLAAVSPFLYRLARLWGASTPLALAVALMWLASPLTQWANLFDFHPETAVPLLLVAGILLFERGRWWAFAVTAVLASATKEDVCLVYVAWGVMLLCSRGRRRVGALLTGAGLAWFLIATRVAIPAFGGNLDFYNARFAADRGQSLGDVFAYLVDHPLNSLDSLATTANIKIIVALIVSTGGLALLAPTRLALAVPGLAANLLSAYPFQHVLDLHYQLVPAAAFAAAGAAGAGVATRRLTRRSSRRFAAALLAGSLAAAIVSPSVRDLLHRSDPGVLAAKRHALSLVPAGVPVAAASDLVPHLTHRRAIYQLPEPFLARPNNGEYWSDADLARRSRDVKWVLIDLDVSDSRLRSETMRLPALLRRKGYAQVYRHGDIRVFEKGRAGALG